MPSKARKLTLADLDLRGRRLLLRADLNAPLANGRVADDSRLRAALPAIRTARGMGAAVVVTSHLGRPGGAPDPAFSLRPVAERLEELLGDAVGFEATPVGDPGGAPELRPGEVLLLENLRFHPGETRNAPEFAAALAAYGDEYVNDAFGAAHRAHASVDACARRFPRAAAGPLLEAELEALGLALGDPPRPFVAILGGAKVSDKLPVILSLLGRADRVLIGGAMTYTFTAAQGLPTGRSLVERDRVAEAAKLLEDHPGRLVLPTDHCTAPAPDTGPVRTLPIGEIAAELDGARHRPGIARRLRRPPSGRGDDRLERAHGALRGSAFRRRDDRRGARRGRSHRPGRDQYRRRRRLARRRAAVGALRPDQSPLDRRRGVPRLPRRRTAPGGGGPRRCLTRTSTRRTVVIGNWKMHKTGAEGAALAAGIVAGLRPGRAEVAVAPPFTALAPVADALRGSSVALAAQDVFHQREGAFTGAVSAPMLAAAGCSIVLAGHSERRHVFGDGDEDVRQKALAVLDAGMRPVVCVGETLEQRDAGQAENMVREQLEAVVRGLSDARLAPLAIAYEPVWAIGTGRTATPDTAEAMHRVIRASLAALAGSEAAERTPILYGGSVKGDNAGAILSGANVDGLLVGGASLRADSFLHICHAAG